jgi:hypothetical protein
MWFDFPDPEKLLQLLRGVMLHYRVMRKIGVDLHPAGFGKIVGGQHEVQPAPAASQRVTSHDQDVRARHERKQTFHRPDRTLFFHRRDLRRRRDGPACPALMGTVAPGGLGREHEVSAGNNRPAASG